MSVYLLVEKSASIEIVTDGGAWTHDGVLRAITSKVKVIEHMPAVVLGRGAARAVEWFAQIAGEDCPTFDDLVDRAADLIAETIWQAAREVDEAMLSSYQVLVAGWSDRRHRLEAYYAEAATAGTLRPASPAMWSGPGEAWRRFLSSTAHPAAREDFDPAEDGVRWMEAMRREPITFGLADGPSSRGYGVGGFVEHVSVKRGGIARQIVRVWPDAVGKPVDPFSEARAH